MNEADFRLEAPGLAGRGRGFRVSLRERTFRPARPHAPSADELARHAAFVARIEGAIWAA